MNNNISITVTGPKDHDFLTLDLNWDASIEDWITIFKTILIHKTFDETSVKEIFEPYLNPDQWMLVENPTPPPLGSCYEETKCEFVSEDKVRKMMATAKTEDTTKEEHIPYYPLGSR